MKGTKGMRIVTVFVSWLMMLFALPSYAVNVDKVIIFGDSLSDNGNIYTFTHAAHRVLPFVPVIPQNPPYYEGRFSNGQVWVELVADAMNVKLVDHAYGGSWVEPVWDSNQVVPFSLSQQVNLYLVENVLDFHKDKHLFVIWSGANDYMQGRSDVEYATTNTVNEIKKQVVSLIYHKAKNILLVSIPNLGVLPNVTQKGNEAVDIANQLTILHNQKLKAMVEEQQQANPTVKIVLVDLTQPFNDLMAHPENFNLKNIKDGCFGGGYYLSPNLINNQEIAAAKDANLDILNNTSLRTAYLSAKLAGTGTVPCEQPDDYVFWDGVHPTRIIHQVIAFLALSTLNDNDIYGKEGKLSMPFHPIDLKKDLSNKLSKYRF